MALLYQSGFENTLAADGWTSVVGGANSVARSADASKNGDNGLLVTCPDAASAYVQTTFTETVDPGGEFYYSFYFRAHTFPASGYAGIARLRTSAKPSQSFLYFFSTGVLRLYHRIDSGGYETFDTNITTGQWYHFIIKSQRASGVGIADGRSNIYVDGALLGGDQAENYTNLAAPVSFYAGQVITSAPGWSFDIDDVRIGTTLADVFPPDTYRLRGPADNVADLADAEPAAFALAGETSGLITAPAPGERKYVAVSAVSEAGVESDLRIVRIGRTEAGAIYTGWPEALLSVRLENVGAGVVRVSGVYPLAHETDGAAATTVRLADASDLETVLASGALSRTTGAWEIFAPACDDNTVLQLACWAETADGVKGPVRYLPPITVDAAAGDAPEGLTAEEVQLV